MWLTNLKIALIEKDTKKIDSLLQDIPQLHNLQEIEQAIYLLKEATILVQSLKDETNFSMQKIKKNISFLNTTKHKPSSRRLDIKS